MRQLSFFGAIEARGAAGLALCALAGCATYQAAPLDLAVPLKPSLAALNRALPTGRTLQITPPLRSSDVAALALLNDPDLIAARAQHDVAQADVLNAGLLPDPVISGNFAALLSGPADAPAIAGSLTQDISPLITYAIDIRAARAGLRQVDAALLWQEWQVASRAEQLCITIAGDQRIFETLQRDRAFLAAVDQATQAALGADNVTLSESSASQIALAGTDNALDAQAQTLAQDRDALDALLGLQPGVVVPVAPPAVPAIDPAVARRAITSLAERRPDLIALRYGYTQADAKLRAAILSQFLPMTIGPAGGRDTSKVVSLGPNVTLTLPLFNRNRGAIAGAVASRAQLAAQFQASLAGAAGDAAALLARIAQLQDQSARADAAAAAAEKMTAQADGAFQNDGLDAVSDVNFETAAADRRREAIALRVQLDTAKISLATLIGLGLPPIATDDLEPAP